MPRGLKLFVFVSFGLTCLCLLTELVCKQRGLQETYWNPLFVGFRFLDFECFQDRFHAVHTAAFFAPPSYNLFAYPAAAALVYAAFYWAGIGASLNLFLAFCSAAWVAVTAGFGRMLQRTGVCGRRAAGFAAATALLAFPFWFCLQRANIELVPFLLVACGLWAFFRGRELLAAACFGLAGAIKVLPLLYLALFVPRRRWRPIVAGLGVAAGTTLVALAYIGPTPLAALAGLRMGAAEFGREFLVGANPNGIGFDHSLLGLLRRVMPAASDARAVSLYVRTMAIAGALLFLLRIRKLPVLNQVLCLCIPTLWLSPISFEYTLINLYPCLALLAVAAVEAPTPEDERRLEPFFLLFAVLLSPLSELIAHGLRFGGQVKAVVLLVLFVLALLRPLRSRFDTGVRQRQPALARQPASAYAWAHAVLVRPFQRRQPARTGGSPGHARHPVR